jgi:hypothetical protein
MFKKISSFRDRHLSASDNSLIKIAINLIKTDVFDQDYFQPGLFS